MLHFHNVLFIIASAALSKRTELEQAFNDLQSADLADEKAPECTLVSCRDELFALGEQKNSVHHELGQLEDILRERVCVFINYTLV